MKALIPILGAMLLTASVSGAASAFTRPGDEGADKAALELYLANPADYPEVIVTLTIHRNEPTKSMTGLELREMLATCKERDVFGYVRGAHDTGLAINWTCARGDLIGGKSDFLFGGTFEFFDGKLRRVSVFPGAVMPGLPAAPTSGTD